MIRPLPQRPCSTTWVTLFSRCSQTRVQPQMLQKSVLWHQRVSNGGFKWIFSAVRTGEDSPSSPNSGGQESQAKGQSPQTLGEAQTHQKRKFLEGHRDIGDCFRSTERLVELSPGGYFFFTMSFHSLKFWEIKWMILRAFSFHEGFQFESVLFFSGANVCRVRVHNICIPCTWTAVLFVENFNAGIMIMFQQIIATFY